MKDKIIEQYINAWNSEDSKDREEFLRNSFDKNGRYTDPHIPEPVQNIHEMEGIIKIFRSRLPHKLKLMGGIEYHSYVFRFKWQMENNGSVLSNGTFVGEFNTENRLTNIICFIDQ